MLENTTIKTLQSGLCRKPFNIN